MIAENYRQVEARVAAACERAGRSRDENKGQDLCRKMEEIAG